MPGVQNKIQDFNLEWWTCRFKLPPQIEYRIGTSVFESHHCVKGGVDFLRLGEEVLYEPKHNDQKQKMIYEKL